MASTTKEEDIATLTMALKRANKCVDELELELEKEKAKQAKFTETVRAVEGLGGVIHQISLRDLFVMAALSGLCMNRNPGIDISGAAVLYGHQTYNHNEMQKSMEQDYEDKKLEVEPE